MYVYVLGRSMKKAFRLISHLIQFHWMFSVDCSRLVIYAKYLYVIMKKKRMKADKNEILDSRFSKNDSLCLFNLNKRSRCPQIWAEMLGNFRALFRVQFFFLRLVFFSIRLSMTKKENLIASHIFYFKIHYSENSTHSITEYFLFICLYMCALYFCLFHSFYVVMFLMTVSYISNDECHSLFASIAQTSVFSSICPNVRQEWVTFLFTVEEWHE